MKVIFGSDHAGFDMKQMLIPYVKLLGHEVVDKGPGTFEREDDYPDFVYPVAEEISKNPTETRGIVIGGSGTGEAIVANRLPGVRAVAYYGGPNEIIRLSRDHNDTNILSLGARFLDEKLAKEAVRLWLETRFSDQERHARRIKKIDERTR